MRWPRDRKFVDRDGQILDPWRGPLQFLEPLLAFSTQDFAALKALIAAAQEESESGETENIFALPIDNEPLFSEDFLISFKNAVQAGRRVAMSKFGMAPQLISTSTFTGNSTLDVSLPAGYTDALLIVKGLSTSANTGVTIVFSEDGGSNLISQTMHVFNDTASQSGTTSAGAGWAAANVNAANTAYARMTIYDYGSFVDKTIVEQGQSGAMGWVGGRILTSVAPINWVQYGLGSGTFDAGTVELWGLP